MVNNVSSKKINFVHKEHDRGTIGNVLQTYEDILIKKLNIFGKTIPFSSTELYATLHNLSIILVV